MVQSGASAAEVVARAVEEDQWPLHVMVALMRLYGIGLGEAKKITEQECARVRGKN